MSKSLKIIILLVTLGLPVAIYLFLQGFGENMYALPVYPEQVVDYSNCGHVSMDYSIRSLTCDGKEVMVLGDNQNYLFHFPDPVKVDIASEMNEMRRLVEETIGVDYRLVTFSSEAQMESWDRLASAQANTRYWVASAGCADKTDEMMNCQLLLGLVDLKAGDSDSRAVLVDRMGRVRGFYASADKGEIDRLLVELDVLMQEK